MKKSPQRNTQLDKIREKPQMNLAEFMLFARRDGLFRGEALASALNDHGELDHGALGLVT